MRLRISTPDRPVSLQDSDELARFIALLVANNVRSYLEIGTRYGGTFERVMSALPVGSTGVAVDFPCGNGGDERSPEDLLAVVRRLRQIGRGARCVFGPSTAPEVFECVKPSSGKFDAILIDGDHRYEGVKRDYELYGPIGRIIAFHDIAGPEGLNSCGHQIEVCRLWSELGTLRRTEIVSPGSIMGIGVIFTDNEVTDARGPIVAHARQRASDCVIGEDVSAG